MPYLNVSGWETGAADEADSVGGTATSVGTTYKRSGTYGLRALASSSFGYHQFSVAAQTTNKSYFGVVYIQIKTLPSADTPIFHAQDTGTPNSGWEVQLTTTGRLRAVMNNGGTYTQVGSDSAILSLDTWYCVEMCIDWDDNQMSVRLDGTNFVTNLQVGSTAGATNLFRVGIGCRGTNVTSGEIWFDDFAAFDGGTSKTAWIGTGGAVIHLLPNGPAGADTNILLSGSTPAATAWQSIDDPAPLGTVDAVDFIEFNNNAGGTCDVDIGAAPTDIQSVKMVSLGDRCVLAGAGSSNHRTGITSGGVNYDGVLTTINNTAYQTNASSTANAKRYRDFWETNPNTSTAWNQTSLDALILRNTSTDSTPRVRVTASWVVVFYVPTGGVSGAFRLQGFARQISQGSLVATGQTRMSGFARAISQGSASLNAAGFRIQGNAYERAQGNPALFGLFRLAGGGLQRSQGSAQAPGAFRLSGTARSVLAGSLLASGVFRAEGRGYTRSLGSGYLSGAFRLGGAGAQRVAQGSPYVTGLTRITGTGRAIFTGVGMVTGAGTRMAGSGFMNMGAGPSQAFGSFRIEGKARILSQGVTRALGAVSIGSRGEIRVNGSAQMLGGAFRSSARGYLSLIGTAVPPPYFGLGGRGGLRFTGTPVVSGGFRMEGRTALRFFYEEVLPDMYELLVPLALGPSNAGKQASLRARMVRKDMTIRDNLPGAAPVTGWLTTGFTERGTLGNYFWYYPSYPDAEVSGIEVDDGTGDILTLFSQNPAEMPTKAKGQYTVARTFRSTGGGTPVIPNALVTLKSVTGAILDRNYSDNDGIIKWALDAGSYLVSAWANGFNYLVDQPLTITGASSDEIDLTPIVTTPPTTLEVCSITDQLVDAYGVPVVNYPVTAVPDPLPQWNTTALVGGEVREALTDNNGMFNLQLVRQQSYAINVELWGLDNEVIYVPDEDNRTLRSLLEDMGILSSEQFPPEP